MLAHCSSRLSHVILAHLESLPAACPVCRVALRMAVERWVDAAAGGARYAGDDLNKGASDGES
jgi:hypothetical protein